MKKTVCIVCVCLLSYLLCAQTVRVGYFLHNGFQEINKQGNYVGYSYEYLQKIAEYTGWNYVYIEESFSECVRMLEAGEIDLLGMLQRTSDRLELFNYPPLPSGSSYSALFTLEEYAQLHYEDFAAFNGLKIGILKNTIQNDTFISYAQEHLFTCTIINYDNNTQLTDALHNKEVDAIVALNLRSENDEKIIARFSPNVFFYATAKQKPLLLRQLNTALAQIKLEDRQYDEKLFVKYYSDNSAQPFFTKEEEAYIKSTEKNPIRVVFDPIWHPISYLNKKTNSYKGITADIFQIILEKSKLHAEIIINETFDRSIEMMHNGSADIFAAVTCIPEFAQVHNMLLTDNYLETLLVLLGKRGAQAGENLSIALPHDHIVTSEYIKQEYPTMHVMNYTSMEECLKAVLDGRVSFTITNSLLLNDFMLDPFLKDISVVSSVNSLFPIAIGVSKEADPLLLSILNETISHLTSEEINMCIITNTIPEAQNFSFIEFMNRYYKQMLITLFFVFLLIIVVWLDTKNKKNAILQSFAFTDSVLHIPNRQAFLHALSKLEKQETSVIILSDIDNFKHANETIGIALADIFLQNLIEFFKTIIPPHSMYRYGGDKFAFILTGDDADNAFITAHTILERFRHAWQINDIEFLTSISLGLVVFPDNGKTENDIICAIDYTIIEAKQNGKKQLVCYNNNITGKITRKNTIIQALKYAVQNDGFSVFIQPIFDMSGKTYCRGEALVRFSMQEMADIMPSEFIPLAEESGLITEIGYIVLEKVCIKIHEMLEKNIVLDHISVNVSVLQLMQMDFTDQVLQLLKKYSIPPQYILLEITESVFVDSIDVVNKGIEILNESGVYFSIDDFGTGYSGFSHILHFKVRELKLDRSFIIRLTENTETQILIKGIIELAHNLDIIVVAEGIETEKQVEILKKLKCDRVQGFYFAHPIQLDEFEKFLLQEIVLKS